MSTEKKGRFSDSQFLIEFLLDANLHSEEGIDDVPEEFVEKHVKNIKSLLQKAKERTYNLHHNNSLYEPIYLNEGNGYYKVVSKKIWSHKSVELLIEEDVFGEIDPIEIVKNKARKVVLQALDDGWTGPPYSAIELAKILNFDIAPNDTIPDARTLSLPKGKVRIEYNPFQPPTRMNFSIAHEIAHTLFSDYHEEIRNREEKPQENRELEQLCNIGAAEFQLPYVMFPADANEVEKITLIGLVELANKYKASLESTFNGFIEAVDRNCATLFFTLQDNKKLALGYSKSSSRFPLSIPSDFILPQDSKGYDCLSPGTSQSETVKWDFLDKDYDVFYVGISPVRKENKPRIGVIIIPNDGRERLQDRKISINYGNATQPNGIGIKIIAQVVNTSAGLGAGFGKAMAKNYPITASALKSWKENKSKFRLGEGQLVKVKDDLYVFQMLAQNGLFPKPGKPLLEYTNLQSCLHSLKERALELNAEVHMPLIGAGNAKGDWNVIEGMIYSELVNQNVKVHIYIWGPKKPNNFNPKESLSLFNQESTWRKEK